MSPRRIFAALAMLALAAITVTAGAAFAGEFPGSDGRDHGWHGKDTEVRAHNGGGSGGDDQDAGSGEVDSAGAGSGSGSGQNPSSGGDASGGDVVTGSGAGTPSAPVEAPAVAPSGPAPDGATAAPTSGPPASGSAADAFVAAGGTTDAPGVVVPAADAVSVTEPALQQSDLAGLAELPVLGSLGQVTGQVSDGPSAARQLLSTGTGRSLAVILALLVAISVFLAVHRRTDRGDRKLAAARTGPEVARFR